MYKQVKHTTPLPAGEGQGVGLLICILNILLPFLHLYLVGEPSYVRRRVFLTTYKQNIALFGNNTVVNATHYSQSAVRKLYDVASGIVEHHVSIYHNIVAFALVHGIVNAVPCAELGPSEVAMHHTYTISLLKYARIERHIGI